MAERPSEDPQGDVGVDTSKLGVFAKAGDVDVVKQILLIGVSQQEKDSATLEASRSGQTEIVNLLIEDGASVNYQDKVWLYFEKCCMRLQLFTAVYSCLQCVLLCRKETLR